MKSAIERQANPAATRKRGILPALGLFFLAPIVAEFLLGNMPISMLGLMAILAPVYGGGALLIRETVRSTGRGWPSILVLGLAYGILEEAFLDQTLFNPDFLSLHLHLLAPAYLPALGIGAWWTIFVLTLHTVWSVSVSIALAEALAPSRTETPWLGNIGLAIVAVLFALACTAMTLNSIRMDAHHFVASHSQFTWSAIACVGLIVIALSLPRRARADSAGTIPSPWLLGIAALASGLVFLFVPQRWAWSAVAIYLLLDIVWIAMILRWSARRAWKRLHPLAMAGGAAMAYGTHAFFETPAVGGAVSAVTRIGNAVFLCAVLAVIAIGVRRTARFERAQ